MVRAGLFLRRVGRAAFELLMALGSPSHRPDEMRLSRSWLALFCGALAGREAFESLMVGVVSPACWLDERRLSCWWCVLALFSVALSGRRVV